MCHERTLRACRRVAGLRVIVIPCSGRKHSGGGPAPLDAEWGLALLDPTSRRSLLEARAELGALLGLAPGPDLGGCANGTIEYLPAYRRYDGNLYRKARLTEADASGASAGRVLIVSALYGVLTLAEPIRDYDLAMPNAVPGATRKGVSGWWKERGLGRLLAEAIEALSAEDVHDLLSGNYRQALSAWPPPLSQGVYRPHAYPGLGTGSDYYRGDDVRRLLSAP